MGSVGSKNTIIGHTEPMYDYYCIFCTRSLYKKTFKYSLSGYSVKCSVMCLKCGYNISKRYLAV